jgi:hypothetical protein
MRTTLTIDDDVLAIAKSLAQARSESLGRVLSDLARRGLEAAPQMERKGKKAFPTFKVAPNTPFIILDDVKRGEDFE